MPKMKKHPFYIIPLTVTLFGLGAANASADPITSEVVKSDTDISALGSFALVDGNNDNLLSFSEYKTFADLRAEASDVGYGIIVTNNDYDLAFVTRDANADGMLSKDELADDLKFVQDDVEISVPSDHSDMPKPVEE